MNQLPDWTPTDNFRTDPHQRLVEGLNGISSLIPDDQLDVVQTPTGRLIGGTGGLGIRPLWVEWGVVSLLGPGSEPALKKEQYWAQVAATAPRDISQFAPTLRVRFHPIIKSGQPNAETQTVVATNLAEMPAYSESEPDPSSSSGSGSGSTTGVGGPHGVRPGAQVRLQALQLHTVNGSSVVAYVFNLTPLPIKAKITTAVPISGAQNRWQYGWVEQRIVKNGRWEDQPNGFTHTNYGGSGSSTVYAYNDAEAFNSDTGVLGNGYNISNLPPSYQPYPIRGNPIVDLYGWTNCDGSQEMHFMMPNAIQGACP